MGLFGNYESSGVGIAKNAPKKKPFFRFWELTGRKFWKLIEVNMLLMTLCIPVIGAAAALYFLINVNTGLALAVFALLLLTAAVLLGPYLAGCAKILRNFTLEKPLFLFDTFKKTFVSCFRQSCIMGLLDILIAGSVAASFYVYPLMIAAAKENGASPTMYYVLFVASLSVALAVLLMSFYAYLMIVSTDLSMKNILKNSLALSCVALKTNLLTLVISGAILGVFILLTVLFPAVMGFIWPFMPLSFIGFVIVFNCYPVIQKYVINPYYAQRGEVNPEMLHGQSQGENVFEDQGGKEKPVEAKKQKKGKGKVIS
ncbi:MAG: hypothetical protein IJ265_07215 [Oscillospiraceae bacterium]|nr:hypothetical protein [Oscillospiraceae bacterium]